MQVQASASIPDGWASQALAVAPKAPQDVRGYGPDNSEVSLSLFADFAEFTGSDTYIPGTPVS